MSLWLLVGGLPDVMGLDDVNDLIDMGAELGRAIPEKKWVDDAAGSGSDLNSFGVLF